MKAKYLWVALLTLLFWGCDDNSGSLGLGMFPGSDQNINGHQRTFKVTTRSEIAENVFAKTSVAYLGRFTDPYFGYYESGFLTQFHCAENFEFPKVYDKNNPSDLKNPNAIMVKDDIYRIELLMTYASYFGDSITASRMSVYRLSEALNKEESFFTDINPAKYYKTTDLLARKAYTAVDLSVKDSIRRLSSYVPSVTVTLPIELGKELYKASREQGKDQFYKNFKDLFKGIYVKNDYGDGTILYIDQIEMRVIFEYYVRSNETGEIFKTHDAKKDSTGYSYRTLAATKEIIQANSFKSDQELIKQKVQEMNWTYLKTPAGIYTQATLPITNIEKQLSQDTLNVAKLIFTNFNQSNDNNKYAFNMEAPNYLLLIREQDRENFFKKNNNVNNITSYLAQHTVYTNQYVFFNLSQLINTCIGEKAAAKIEAGSSWDEEKWIAEHPLWNKVAIIPVAVNIDSNKNITSILNELKPGYAKLKGGRAGEGENGKAENQLDLEVTYTSFATKN